MRNELNSVKRCYDIINAGPKNRFSVNGGKIVSNSMMDPNLYNLPRPRGIYKDAVEDGLLDINQAFEFIRTGEPELLEAAYGPKLGQPMEFLADSIRSFIVAEPGHELVAVDYSSIQGVLAAWFAGEDWKLKAMAEIIADPKKAKCPSDLSAGWAAGQMCIHYAKGGNIDKLWQYTERLPREVQVSMAKSLLERSGSALLNSPALIKWIHQNKALINASNG